MPLGITMGICYAAAVDELKRGESLVLFSDGLTDAMNSKREVYGLERIVDAVRSSNHEDASGLVRHIISDVERFVGGNRQFDDMCLVCVHRREE